MANEKHIFIGLGGSGCQTVTQIKEKVYANRYPTHTATKSRLEAMNETYRFLFIDTDQRDIDQANKNNRKSFEEGKVPFINPQSDLVNLGLANPQAIYYEATQDTSTLINKRILEACSPELSVKIPDQPLGFGAGAFRIKSRIAFAHSLTDFQTKLQSAISALNDVKTVGGESCTIFYWVVASSNGGTGSGIVNDVLYHINQIHKQIVGDGDPQLILIMYMPKVYIDCNATEEKYALNAYAVFSEIQAFKEMSQNRNQNTVMHRMAFVNDYNLIDSKRKYCPFYYLIPIDIQTDKGTSLGSTHVMYHNTAEMIYILHHGAGGETFRSDIDNYMNDIMERNHEDFLVPMGYVQLHKPTDQFNRYFRARFERDLLRTWLLNAEAKENAIPESKVPDLYNKLFRELSHKIPGTIASRLVGTQRDNIDADILDPSLINGKEELPATLKLSNVESELETVEANVKAASIKPEERSAYKQQLVSGAWKQAEEWIREHGLIYAINAVDAVRTLVRDEYEKQDNEMNSKKDELDDKRTELEKLEKEAETRSIGEKITKTNKEDIQEYRNKLEEYVDDYISFIIKNWAHDLLRDFCNNDKSDELSKLKNQLMVIKEKASEKNEQAVRYYDKLATEFGNTALDVTTVYLPMLKDICNGNGWKPNNFFSRCYRNIIQADEDRAETPNREDITKLIKEGIYDTKNEKRLEQLMANQYILIQKEKSEKGKKEQVTEECRFFANPTLEDRKPEAIIEDFVEYAQHVLEVATRENKNIQENWANKKVSHFFHDLPNEQKDEVRKSLSPALFFNYNTARIEVTKKEEHYVFVAQDRDLAKEMLGYEEGNIKHRYVSGGDANSALVLKSKYGLSFRDYRIYDNIEMVYNNATFREKYHFHHDFAQFLGKITLNDLPDEVLSQHHTFVKMLILKEYEKDLKPLFYEDEYDPESYETSMYLVNEKNATSFEIARPEAFSLYKGALCLRKVENGKKLYDEVSGGDFSIQFEEYFKLFYNRRYSETLDRLLQAILRQKKTAMDKDGQILHNEDGSAIVYDGEQILKNLYSEKKNEVLKKIALKKQQSTTDDERRLYNLFYNIIRDEYDTVHKFIG